VLGAAIPDQRAHNGWVEGVAIWVAIALVVRRAKSASALFRLRH
jgi:hypothetical protein